MVTSKKFLGRIVPMVVKGLKAGCSAFQCRL